MVWIIPIVLLLLILFLILVSPIELHIDTRIPQLSVRWTGIAKAIIIYEGNDWRLKAQFLFFKWQWPLLEMIFSERKAGRNGRQKTKTSIKQNNIKRKKWSRLLNIPGAFRMVQWQIAIDTGDHIKNAWLYPLNFFSPARQHVHVNFVEENYLVLTTRSTALQIVYALIK